MTEFDKLRQQIYEELMDDSTLYCVYCGQSKYRISCCGENHYVPYADMYPEDQMAILDEMVADELELLAKEKK